MIVSDYHHTSVLLGEAVAFLVHEPSGCYVDGTFGRGGHSQQILHGLSEHGKLLAIDKDPEAISIARKMAREDGRMQVVQASFSKLNSIFEQARWQHGLDGVLLDLGVSSPQLDDPERGFSFMHDGPLDMRMNPDMGKSAAEWLAKAESDEIADVLYHYGEERFSRRMARAIVTYRRQQPITRTKQLAEIIKTANPKWEKGKHPATRAFQGIRIYINGELSDLENGLVAALDVLKPGGRLVVISFHSLEDRIVKRFMRNQAQGDSHLPLGLPVTDAQLYKRLKLLGKAHKPNAAEIAANPRARSAVMRVAEKLL